MAYRQLGDLSLEPAAQRRRRGIRPVPGPGSLKVWHEPNPDMTFWENRPTPGTARSPRFHYPIAQHYQALEGYFDGLGFSLKPPKWVRKLTIKKAIKPLLITAAVVGGAALIPGALPMIGKAFLGAGKLAFGGVKLAGKGVTGLVKLVGKGIGITGAKSVPKTGISPQMDVRQYLPDSSGQAVMPTTGSAWDVPTAAQAAAQDAASQAAAGKSPLDLLSMLLPKTPAQAAAQMPSSAPTPISLQQLLQMQPGAVPATGATVTPSPYDVPTAAQAAAPSPYDVPTAAQAGFGSSMIPLAVAAAALLAVSMMNRRS